MDQPELAFTAVFLKGRHGYTGFVEELPGVNSQGQTLEEARSNLQCLAAVVFEAEPAQSAELLAGKEVVRELPANRYLALFSPAVRASVGTGSSTPGSSLQRVPVFVEKQRRSG